MASINLNKKQIRWILVAAAVVVVALLLFFGFRRRSGYLFDAAGTSSTAGTVGVSGNQDSYDLQLQSNLISCETTFDLANNYINTNDPSNSSLRTLILSNLQSCSQVAVTNYMTAKCPISSLTASGFTSKPSVTDSAVQDRINGGWSNLNSDYNSITNAYVSLVNVTAAGTTLDQIKAARKADYTAAARRFVAFVCPGYYNSANVDTINDFYNSYRIGNATYGFDSSRITLSNVQSWASNAASTSAGTAPLVSSGVNYATNTPLTNQLVFGTGTASVPKWVAALTGPGTVSTGSWVSYSANNTLTLGRTALPIS